MTEITAPPTSGAEPDTVEARAAARVTRSLVTLATRVPRRLVLLAVPGLLALHPLTARLDPLYAIAVIAVAYTTAFVIFYARRNMIVDTGAELTGEQLDAAREAAQNPKRVQRDPVDI